MTKTLNSILEMAIVIGGLIAAPIVVLASIESVAAAPADRGAIVQQHSSDGVTIAELKL